jgi:hypothetical protein
VDERDFEVVVAGRGIGHLQPSSAHNTSRITTTNAAITIT